MIKCHITPELDSVGRLVSFKQKKENSFEPWLSPARAHDGMVIDNFTQVKNFLNATRTRVRRPGNRAIAVLLSHEVGPKVPMGNYWLLVTRGMVAGVPISEYTYQTYGMGYNNYI